MATLYVPAGLKEAYSLAEGWENFTNIVEVDFEEDAGGDEPLFADVNGDGVVDVADVTAVVSVIMGVYNE